MRIVTHICRWLSTAMIALVISTVAFAIVSILYERLELQRRLGVDDDVCWLALALGPALIVVIHRSLHERAWVPVWTLAGGLVLGVLGSLQWWSAREAKASHVPSGPFSGMEHDLGMLLGVFLGLIAVLAMSAGILALVARRLAR